MPDSSIVTATAPVLLGAWIHDAANPDATERHWIHTDGGDEELDVEEELLQFVGRRYPVLESGTVEDQHVSTVVTVPFGADQRAAIDWWKARKRAATTLFYRDGRGRVFPCVIAGKLAILAQAVGSTVGVTMQRVDYPAPTTLSATDYNPAVPDDGGYGDGGYGERGYGL